MAQVETVLRLQPRGVRGEPAQSLLLSSHRAQPAPRAFPCPRDGMGPGSESALPRCHPTLGKELWARLQGAGLALDVSRVWEASSHCSVPAPEAIGVPGMARSPLGSLGQGELEVL